MVAVGRDQHEGFSRTVFLYPTTSQRTALPAGTIGMRRPASVPMYGFPGEGANAGDAPPVTPLPELLA